MAIILRFVNNEGSLKKRLFQVLSVEDTCSQTLKDEISKVLRLYNLHVENMRGQGYDGASNMHGQFNGLQALFLKECPYAYYIHCFAHRLQLCLNAAAKGVHDVWQFFYTLNMIVNFVYSSAKTHSMLKACREAEIADLVAVATPETAQSTINDLYLNGVDKVQGEAKAVGKAMKKFDFVYCLHMMHDIMRITDFLCQTLQKKDLDILNALHFILITKGKLKDMRENGWNDLIKKVRAFCCQHDISMPDMSAPYKKRLRNCEENITNEEYYRINIIYVVIDFQLSELDTRFTETSVEILRLSGSFDPRHSFRAFKGRDVCDLALKYYPSDFSSHDMSVLELEFSTATTERAFSSIKIIKRRLRNKMNDEFLYDLMVLYIERKYADNIETNEVIDEFELSGSRRVEFN
ncbi:uncharacterized protein LOC141628563 [Silene latifolia]|uniref:uncharacterized protein LOC141628563 n=1 Tax=Silene latifolia TaxID=37657 RepID=UPI003D76A5EA